MFYYTLNAKTWKSCFCFFTDGRQHELREVDMIAFGNHALLSYMTWLPVTLTWLLYNLQLWRHGHWFKKFTVRFLPIKKGLESSMYNNYYYIHTNIFNSILLVRTLCRMLKRQTGPTGVLVMATYCMSLT